VQSSRKNKLLPTIDADKTTGFLPEIEPEKDSVFIVLVFYGFIKILHIDTGGEKIHKKKFKVPKVLEVSAPNYCVISKLGYRLRITLRIRKC